jgi:adenine-specific DNA glycosylase
VTSTTPRWHGCRPPLAWFDRQARAFDFRGVRDPYAILVSEVILQQTQATRRTCLARIHGSLPDRR